MFRTLHQAPAARYQTFLSITHDIETETKDVKTPTLGIRAPELWNKRAEKQKTAAMAAVESAPSGIRTPDTLIKSQLL